MLKKNNPNNLNEVPDNKSFGFLMTVVFLIGGLRPLFYSESPYPWAIIIAVVFLFFTLRRPNQLTPLNILWKNIGMFLHKIFSPILLGIIFYMIITPFGYLIRFFDKNFLNLKQNPNVESYWIKVENRIDSQDSMKYQF